MLVDLSCWHSLLCFSGKWVSLMHTQQNTDLLLRYFLKISLSMKDVFKCALEDILPLAVVKPQSYILDYFEHCSITSQVLF